MDNYFISMLPPTGSTEYLGSVGSLLEPLRNPDFVPPTFAKSILTHEFSFLRSRTKHSETFACQLALFLSVSCLLKRTPRQRAFVTEKMHFGKNISKNYARNLAVFECPPMLSS